MQSETRRPGNGPRNAEAIFQATLELLVEGGYEGLTIEGVAARSGVNKTTIYRWWPSKDALLHTAFVQTHSLETEAPDTGSLRGDLTAVAASATQFICDPAKQRVIRASLAGLDRPGLAGFARQLSDDGLVAAEKIFTRAVDRGELTPGVDPETVIDLIVGAVWYHVLIRQTPLPEGFTERIIDIALAGLPRP